MTKSENSAFDGHALSSEAISFLRERHRLLIDGRWMEGASDLETTDPATQLPICRFDIGGAAEINVAVAAARRAFEGSWSRFTAAERAAVLTRLARLIEKNATLLTELDVIDNGMPRFIAGLTAANAVEMVDYYASAVLRIEGRTMAPPRHIAAEGEALTYTLKEPVGVVGQIIPWNVPLSMAILKLTPALAAGCTVILKPAELTPLSAIALGRLVLEAGFPDGVVNIVNGLGAGAGAALANHPGVDKISFTGSTATGRKIIEATTGNIKKAALELGGKSPVVVMPDADLAMTAPGGAMATFFLQGQNCMAGTRVFVHQDIHDALIDAIQAFAATMKLGHGLDPATMQGPLISAEQRAKALGYIASGQESGATLVCGGHAPDRRGFFVQPTIFTDVRSDMRIMREEIFGPVMAVQRFASTDLDDIARLANDTPYGLSGSVWTQSLSVAHKLAARIRAGHVSINCHGAVGTNIPFGGFGQSGWGREFGEEGLNAYLETKAVTARL